MRDWYFYNALTRVLISICSAVTSLIIGIILTLFLAGCKTQYIPVETIKTEIVHKTDTVEKNTVINNEKETILREARPEDSAMIAKLGIKLKDNEILLILLQNELRETRDELYEIHNRDSVKTDSVQVPYPVERELSKWESFCLDYGKLMLGGTILGVIVIILWLIFWIRRKLL